MLSSELLSLTDVEYANRRRVSRREQFLEKRVPVGAVGLADRAVLTLGSAGQETKVS